MHPRAQIKLFNAILNLSKTKQIFLATHSPYFFSNRALNQIGIFLFTSENDNSCVEKIDTDWGLFPWSPSWGEINYYAYKLPMVEFHNELYGYIQEKEQKFSTSQVEQFFSGKGLELCKTWVRENNGNPGNPESVTLQTYIRHKIHHPENSTMQNDPILNHELQKSIDEMISILNSYD